MYSAAITHNIEKSNKETINELVNDYERLKILRKDDNSRF